ncbi:hypothetical protein BDQ17DRAFT_1437698 [Cyathus striatus]|nr:hypothetical protein BDQ17DRAFT_1437698 [Cyathus striatus]
MANNEVEPPLHAPHTADGKGKTKVIQELSDDKDTANLGDDKNTPNVPSLIWMLRPRGGAAAQPSSRSEDTGPTLQALLNEMREIKVHISCDTRHPQWAPLKPSPKFKTSPKRTIDPERTEILSYVWPLMNLLLDIEKDADCVNIQQADMDSVMQYTKGLGEGPTGMPFHPFFEKLILCAMDDNEDQIYELFFQHLICLKKFMDSTKPRPGESEARHVQCVSHQRVWCKEMQRPCTRRNHLFNLRMEIADGNQTYLSAGGMSSDETDDDQSEGQKFWIKKHSWRSNALINYLSIIDKDHNFTTAYAEKHPVIPGLPRNFYDETWYNSLSSHDKKYLDAQNEIELPEIAQMNH